MDIKTAFIEVYVQPNMAKDGVTLEELFQEFSQWAMQEQMKVDVDQVTEDQATAIKAEATEIVNRLNTELNYERELSKEDEVISDLRMSALQQHLLRLSEILNITLENTDEPGTTED